MKRQKFISSPFEPGEDTSTRVLFALSRAGLNMKFTNAVFHKVIAATKQECHIISYLDEKDQPRQGKIYLNENGEMS